MFRKQRQIILYIDLDGKLHLGRGHSYLANGADVQAAGTMKINSGGYVRSISNASGHYTPTIQQANMFPELLNSVGVRTKNAWLEVGDYYMTPSGLGDLNKTKYYSKQLKE